MQQQSGADVANLPPNMHFKSMRFVEDFGAGAALVQEAGVLVGRGEGGRRLAEAGLFLRTHEAIVQEGGGPIGEEGGWELARTHVW